MSAAISARSRVQLREIVLVAIILAASAVLLPGLWAAVDLSTLVPALAGGLAIGAAALSARSAGGR